MTVETFPISAGQREFLRRPENQRLLHACSAALATLHGLAARYTGSMYFVMVPDEAEAIGMFRDRLAQLASVPHLAATIRRNFAAYEALRTQAAQDGLTEQVRESAMRLMHGFSDENLALFASDADGYGARCAVAG